jgi:hypothetical protein
VILQKREALFVVVEAALVLRASTNDGSRGTFSWRRSEAGTAFWVGENKSCQSVSGDAYLEGSRLSS